jgi:hypothetical protein
VLQDAIVKKDSTQLVKTSVYENLNVPVCTMARSTRRAKYVRCTAIIGRSLNGSETRVCLDRKNWLLLVKLLIYNFSSSFFTLDIF